MSGDLTCNVTTVFLESRVMGEYDYEYASGV